MSNEERLGALELLVAIIGPKDQVTGHKPFFPHLTQLRLVMIMQGEEFSPRTQDVFKRLRSLCDSVMHSYLSKIADTEEKRNYMHVVCTAVEGKGLMVMGNLNLLVDDLPRVLDLHPSIFQPCEDLRVFLAAIANASLLSGYLMDFLSSRERSRMFYYDPGLWNSFIATRLERYLEMPSDEH